MITLQRIMKATGKHFTCMTLTLQAALGARRTRYCPACGQDIVGFFRYGGEREWGCADCGASPRERLMNHLLDDRVITLPAGASILHMAPNEKSLVQHFSEHSESYRPADLDPARYNVPGVARVDLMELVEEAKFDRIYASHVMEHVPDDRLVLANLYRALKPGGEAWLLVPLWDKPTEDGSYDVPPRERERRFGQWDHVRQYGPDFADRIRAAGFELELLRAEDVDAHERWRMGLGDLLFRAIKPATK